MVSLVTTWLTFTPNVLQSTLNILKSYQLSKSGIKAKIKSATKANWQRMWNLHQGTHSHNLMPTVSLAPRFSNVPVIAQKLRNRMILNHSKLRERMHQILPLATTSPTCPCREAAQSVHHIVMHCSLYSIEREAMIDAIERSFIECNTPTHRRVINLKTLLCPDFDRLTNLKTEQAMATFLVTTDLKA